jgi:hypothetical protein
MEKSELEIIVAAILTAGSAASVPASESAIATRFSNILSEVKKQTAFTHRPPPS